MTAVTAAVWVASFISCHDGDTCTMQVEIWPDVVVTTPVRFRGIDTPERAGGCAAEKMLANAARSEVVQLLQAAEVITLTGVAPDKYGGRVLANVAADGVPVGALLIEMGLARPYAGGARQSWCDG